MIKTYGMALGDEGVSWGDPVSTECREESRVKGGTYATGSLCDLDLTFNRGSFLNEKLG